MLIHVLLGFRHWRCQRYLLCHLVCIDAYIYVLARSLRFRFDRQLLRRSLTNSKLAHAFRSNQFRIFGVILGYLLVKLKLLALPFRSWNLRFSFGFLISLLHNLLM